MTEFTPPRGTEDLLPPESQAMAVLYDEFRAVLWPEEATSSQRASASQTAETANPVESRWEC